LKTNPTLAGNWTEVAQFAGWAVQAATGNGADAVNLTPAERIELRKKALAWLTECMKRLDPRLAMAIGTDTFRRQADLAPVRDPSGLAKLLPEERAEWERFWANIAAAKPLPVAPMPRLKKV
jgi:eukaryotic-like serine/threonine-protein kinase